MGDRTGIAWTDATWNPWMGCRKVSQGCAHCYMYREQSRWGRNPLEVVRASPRTFRAPLTWSPLRWREPRRVFTCSWSDFFIEEADAWRPDAWDIIRRTPHLTYQVLTKRPERAAEHLPADWGTSGYPNVWLGVSVESERFVERLECLSKVPCQVHFVSAEPLLGSLRLGTLRGLGVDWVIVGGESGPGARPMDLNWAREIRDLCQEEQVPFFLKQLGGFPDSRSHEQARLDGRTWTEMPILGGGTRTLASVAPSTDNTSGKRPLSTGVPRHLEEFVERLRTKPRFTAEARVTISLPPVGVPGGVFLPDDERRPCALCQEFHWEGPCSIDRPTGTRHQVQKGRGQL